MRTGDERRKHLGMKKGIRKVNALGKGRKKGRKREDDLEGEEGGDCRRL